MDEEETPVDPKSKLLEQLQARHAANAEATTIDIPVPGMDGALIARYERVEWEESERIGKMVTNGKQGVVLDSMLDLMAKACVEVLGAVPGQEPEPLIDSVRGYSREVSDALVPGSDCDTARQVILAIFPTPQAVTPHFLKLQSWLDYSNEDGSAF